MRETAIQGRFGVRVPRTFDYPTINLNLHIFMITMHACPRQTDRRTDRHMDSQMNIMAIA